MTNRTPTADTRNRAGERQSAGKLPGSLIETLGNPDVETYPARSRLTVRSHLATRRSAIRNGIDAVLRPDMARKSQSVPDSVADVASQIWCR
jgi:hypothetical protein